VGLLLAAAPLGVGGEDLEAGGVLAEPVGGAAHEVERLEAGLEEAHGRRAGREAEEEALDLVVHHPAAVAPERGLEGGVLGGRPPRHARRRGTAADAAGMVEKRVRGLFPFLNTGFIYERGPFLVLYEWACLTAAYRLTKRRFSFQEKQLKVRTDFFPQKIGFYLQSKLILLSG